VPNKKVKVVFHHTPQKQNTDIYYAAMCVFSSIQSWKWKPVIISLIVHLVMSPKISSSDESTKNICSFFPVW